jgi:hypothetical protein
MEPPLPDWKKRLLLARYTENCEQARHHEAMRERTTSMVAQTTGVILGLFGFKEGSWHNNPVGQLLAVFVIILGAWGIFSVCISESRIRRHRERITEIKLELDSKSEPSLPTRKTWIVWSIFHCGVVILGLVLLCIAVQADFTNQVVSKQAQQK